MGVFKNFFYHFILKLDLIETYYIPFFFLKKRKYKLYNLFLFNQIIDICIYLLKIYHLNRKEKYIFFKYILKKFIFF
jgi:hypothetical protein